jgi:hypothetical protein
MTERMTMEYLKTAKLHWTIINDKGKQIGC